MGRARVRVVKRVRKRISGMGRWRAKLRGFMRGFGLEGRG